MSRSAITRYGSAFGTILVLVSLTGNFIWYTAADDLVERSCMSHIENVHAEALRSQQANQPGRAARLFGYLVDFGSSPRDFCNERASERHGWLLPFSVAVESHQRDRRYRAVRPDKLETIYAWEEAFVRRSYSKELAKLSVNEEIANQKTIVSRLLFEGDEVKADEFLRAGDSDAPQTRDFLKQ